MAFPSSLRIARLTLRQLTESDLTVLIREIGRWEVAQWLIAVPHPYTSADADWWLKTTRARHMDETQLHFVAVPEGETEMVGAVGLDLSMHGLGEAELGYWLAPSAWGRGYGTEMARAMVACGFTDISLSAIQAGADVRNHASNAVLTKAGLRLDRVEPAHPRGLRGGPAPANIHRITRSGFEAGHDHD